MSTRNLALRHTIRKATIKDCGLINRLAWKAFPPTYQAILTPEQIAELLPLAKELEGLAKDLTGEAQNMIEQGEHVPGYKLVIGRAGNRSFTDADKAIQRAKDAGIAEAMLYERRPITLSAMEKLMGKEDFELACGDLVTRAPGKPTLVPESDKRQAYNPNAAVAAEFGLDL